ncbi:MAG: diguanylate cyclase [Desulfuromusa sp.]|jgi:diguanylate cyclase (GGDEF)-like protein|nr:diguanylate cyclase [Desulfuromusa sp.]
MLEPLTYPKPDTPFELLIVDDQHAQLKSLKQLLHFCGYTNVALASGGDQAIRILQNSFPALILLDLQMPETNGLDVLEFHQQAGLDSEIIVISGETSFPWVKEAMRLGAFDFIRKPYKPQELLTTIAKALDRFQEKQKFQQDQKTIRYLAYYDQLTNLPNRQLFNDRARQVLVHAQRSDQKFALLFMDMDSFKDINDNLGHLIGDRVLQLVAARILGCVREEDTLSRYGGDEFALLLPEVTGQHGVTTVVKKILKEVRKPFHINEHELQLSLSIGIAIYPSTGTDLDMLLHNADTAMYHVKTHSKDNYCFYSDDIYNKHRNTKIPHGLLDEIF